MNTPASYPSAVGLSAKNPVQPANARSETTATTQLGGGEGLTKQGAFAAQNRPPDAGRSSKAGGASRDRSFPNQAAPSKPQKRGSTKTDLLLRKLTSSKGLPVTTMMKITGWQPYSVGGFLASTVSKKLTHNLRSQNRQGRSSPLSHRSAERGGLIRWR